MWVVGAMQSGRTTGGRGGGAGGAGGRGGQGAGRGAVWWRGNDGGAGGLR